LSQVCVCVGTGHSDNRKVLFAGIIKYQYIMKTKIMMKCSKKEKKKMQVEDKDDW
jgi:hypothetical protein